MSKYICTTKNLGGLTMDQKHVVLAASSFALGGALVWWWLRRQAAR